MVLKMSKTVILKLSDKNKIRYKYCFKTGLIECTYLAANLMDKRKGGKGGVIVNIASVAGN